MERHEKIKKDKHFLEYKEKVFEVPNGFVPQGVSEVSFSFKLPEHIPSSFYYKDKKCREKPMAKVKYTVGAKLEASPDMKYKQVLIIREPPVAFKAGEVQQETSQIKTCCCLDKGTSSMSSVFEKNVFMPNEHVRGSVKVDNANCQIDCTNVHFAVEQRFKMKAEGHSYSKKTDLEEKNVEGPKAGEGDWHKELDLDLSKIKYEVQENVKDKKTGKKKKLSPEDGFQMASIQPACHGKWIDNDYHLIVNCTYDGCTCCSNLPDSDSKMTIVPMVNPACFGFQAPGGWMPHQLGGFTCEVKHHK